ncbi:hypothetical protein MTR67_006785 [Solanum verrucosum]|uniref:Integrase catalytic domain-containing protein n=1 Tax=Solanum verrucosum TaxID=315347 RepID=A0AAF0Q0U4_SOLVR|nr:hypothetical protein MTR67_006785 [Solanum verrucosum]
MPHDLRGVDRGPQLTYHFWKSFQKGLGTNVNLSTTFHPHTDGHAEHSIQTLEDMLIDCVIDFKGSRDDHLPLKDFAYNNSHNFNIQMAPYEALYWRRCKSPVCSFEQVSPTKRVMRFSKIGKLSTRYVGHYKILKMVGKVAYEFELPPELAAVHPFFHISLLKKCVGDPISILPLECVAVKVSLAYEEVPVEILDR